MARSQDTDALDPLSCSPFSSLHPAALRSTLLALSARHGEGFHNAAEAKYGSEAWESKWSKLDGDDDGLVWGPDAELTPRGERQIKAMREKWAVQLKDEAPLPEVFLSSGLTRALQTWEITWDRILGESKGDVRRVLEVREVSQTIPLLGRDSWVTDEKIAATQGIREHNGVHTCDKRRTKVSTERVLFVS